MRVLREVLGDETLVMIDANQAWDREMALASAAFAPAWLEEPMRADTPAEKWAELARRSPIALAASEDIRGAADFENAIASMGLRYLQPDIGKWGV